MPTRAQKSGFTLIELLVAMSILFMLASIVLTHSLDAEFTAHDAKRISDLREVQQALEQYAGDHNGAYPDTGTEWHSQCTYWGGYTNPADVIPGLSPTYISQIPSDPDMDTTAGGNGACCYLYISDSVDYDFMDYNCPLAGVSNPTVANMLDPRYTSAWAVFLSLIHI